MVTTMPGLPISEWGTTCVSLTLHLLMATTEAREPNQSVSVFASTLNRSRPRFLWLLHTLHYRFFPYFAISGRAKTCQM
jgi:hypothetical protein